MTVPADGGEAAPAALWPPAPDARERSRIGRYLSWLETERGLAFADYDGLWRWSISDLDGFWTSVWEHFEVSGGPVPRPALAERAMPGARWFPTARLNYAERLLAAWADRPTEVALVAYGQTRPPIEVEAAALAHQVAQLRAALVARGVGKGDRVAAYLPNIPETVVAFLACASIGAIWCSCATEFGPRSVIDRFSQVEPKVLLAVAGYRYGDELVDCRPRVAEVLDALPSVEVVVEVPYSELRLGSADVRWPDLLAEAPAGAEPVFEPVAFDHPLVILFSSGTTGLPKAIVHGHGGVLLEHLKNHALSWDLGPGDRFMWFTTTAWMMWNALVSGLLVGASLVLVDGNPLHPGLGWQWEIASATGATVMGLSPGFIMACRRQGEEPARRFDLTRLRALAAAGSPLPAEGSIWIHEQFGPGVPLNVGSGGTDVCTGLVQGCPLLPVWAGEMSGRCLGVSAWAYDDAGQPIVGELGELVITEPMPSMPVALWGDDDGRRLAATYFEQYPGVMRFGDWIRFSERGSCVITGRSDATLNRGGVRIGTAELYRVVEDLPGITDSLAVHLEDDEGGPGELILLVVTEDGGLDDERRRSIASAVRHALSPRHVPDTIWSVRDIPRNLTGKKLELPVKKILLGADPASVVSRDAMANPASLPPIIELAAARCRSHTREEGAHA